MPMSAIRNTSWCRIAQQIFLSVGRRSVLTCVLTPLRLAALADLDDLHGVGSAGRPDRLAESDHDQVALAYQPGGDQLVLRLLQEVVAVVADVLDHKRIDIAVQAQPVTRGGLRRQ